MSAPHKPSPQSPATAADEIQLAFRNKLRRHLGRPETFATPHDVYFALALVVRDRVFDHAVALMEQVGRRNSRRVAYLSAEYLPGPHLANALLSLGLTGAAREAMAALGHDLDTILDQEEEPGLGNGGLGRLASCYMDSLAALDVPAVGYGIRYEFGIFDQTIQDGWQSEITDKWLRFGNAWEVVRPEVCCEVGFGGHTESWQDTEGRFRVRWVPENKVVGVACDTPVPGYGSHTCNILRLWKAEAVESFDFACFNHGDYYCAVEQKVASETITKVLYPNDESQQGKALRLKQQFFFCTCALQDMLRLHLLLGQTPETFHEAWAAQINDTHPAIAVAELMRLLLDRHGLEWDAAWNVTSSTFAYTNHTLLPEALEKWPVDLFGSILPRHLELIYEINQRFLDGVRTVFPGDGDLLARLSIIDESGPRFVRMAHLACVGSRHINGVAALHSELLKETVLCDFARLWPHKFRNVTNGVTPRRFVALSNPALASLIDARLGEGWLKDPSRLTGLEPLADDAGFQEKWRAAKRENKRILATLIADRTGIGVDPGSLFDIQVKRIHEYKRQHLNVLHILTLYLRLKRDPAAAIPPRTFIFGGKAAPGYFMAKRIIKLITATGDLVNGDPDVGGRLKVVFFPDFNVKNAQFVYPAADLSEQISTAGKEASGTGNMKFTFNGALTIGTLDGANVEIREEVGKDNFFLFGLDASEVASHKAAGYRPRGIYEGNPELRDVIDFIASGALAGGDRGLFQPLVDNLLHEDPFLVLADYAAYVETQATVGELWNDTAAWTRRSILNTARAGKFSSDRSIRDYCELIWNIRTAP